MKIFEFNQGQKGTLIDSVSKDVLTTNNFSFKKSEKGITGVFNEATRLVKSNAGLNGVYSLRFWVKPKATTLQYLFTDNTVPLSYRIYLNSGLIFATIPVADKYINGVLNGVVKENEWNELIVSNISIVSSAFTFGAYTGAGNGLIGEMAKFEIYQGTLTQSQINRFYEEFLQASPTEKEVRGFEYPKPTDLSSEVDSKLGSEKISNGDFSSVDMTSWSEYDVSGVVGTYEGRGNVAKITITSPDTCYISQNVRMVSGQKYLVSVNYFIPTTNTNVNGIRLYNMSGINKTFNVTGKWAVASAEFIAADSNIRVDLVNSDSVMGNTVGDFGYFDKISIKPLNGLVAAYNMIPNGNTLVDISGNGNNLTNYGAISTSKGFITNGTTDYFSGNLANDTTGFTIAYYGTPKSASTNFGGLVAALGASSRFNILFTTTGQIKLYIKNNTGTITLQPNTTQTFFNKRVSIVLTKQGNDIKLYTDGLQILDVNPTNLDIGALTITTLEIGRFSGNGSVGAEFEDVRIFNKGLTADEVKAYHNSFVKPVLLEDFSRNPVGNTTLRDWLIPSGGFVVEEDDFKTKYIKATSGSAINCAYIQSNLIDGEWQVDLKYTSSPGYIAIASERPEASLTNFTGYIVLYNASGNSGNIFIRRYINGTATNLFVGSAGDISANKWWRLRFTKKSCGTINLYAKNLTDNEPWKEITTGTITDSTITKSGYFGLTLVLSGTQIKNIKIYNGVKQ